jgi:signal peptidase I
MEPNLYQGDLAFVFKSAFNIRLPFSEYELFRIRRPRASYEVVASVSNVAGVVTIESSTVTPIYESNSLWDVVVDSVSQYVRIMVTDGSDTETIRWVATVRTSELTYP